MEEDKAIRTLHTQEIQGLSEMPGISTREPSGRSHLATVPTNIESYKVRAVKLGHRAYKHRIIELEQSNLATVPTNIESYKVRAVKLDHRAYKHRIIELELSNLVTMPTNIES